MPHCCDQSGKCFILLLWGIFFTLRYQNHGESSGCNSEYSPYMGKVILLMDEGTQSQSEFAIMSLRQAPNTTVLENPSIGADRNITIVKLPGTIQFPISGLGVYTPE